MDEQETRQQHALDDVDHSSAWGVVVAILAAGALLGLLAWVDRRTLVIAIPLVLVAIAFKVARPSHPNH